LGIALVAVLRKQPDHLHRADADQQQHQSRGGQVSASVAASSTERTPPASVARII